jgi:hypothetical protein
MQILIPQSSQKMNTHQDVWAESQKIFMLVKSFLMNLNIRDTSFKYPLKL